MKRHLARVSPMPCKRTFSAEFSAWGALEAPCGVETINEIAAEHDLHRVPVSQWC